MKLIRIALVAVALVAALGAALLAKGFMGQEKQKVEVKKGPDLDVVQVLVAAKSMKVGQKVTASMLKWHPWPKAALSKDYIVKDRSPNALKNFTNSTARAPLVENEPILARKLVKSGDGGFMAAVLPKGLRAISVKISPETGAGGFILPNDRVDVILTRRQRSKRSGDDHVSETILTNVRVLAIDQALKGKKEGKDGQVAIGKTATLALRGHEAEQLALAEASGDISLALRSMEDSDPSGKVDDDMSDFDRRSGSITVLRYGIPSQVSARQ